MLPYQKTILEVFFNILKFVHYYSVVTLISVKDYDGETGYESNTFCLKSYIFSNVSDTFLSFSQMLLACKSYKLPTLPILHYCQDTDKLMPNGDGVSLHDCYINTR